MILDFHTQIFSLMQHSDVKAHRKILLQRISRKMHLKEMGKRDKAKELVER